jgi:NADPH-dependent 2,4-dienoyl-CoA reductase/sulfur reductase-like enzyme
VNPRVGICGEIEPVAEKDRKSVMVIGGGPAGMMAAQTLKKRGHEVTLYEKSDRLGGLLNDATLVPFKNYMKDYLEWDIRQTMKCGAKIVLGTEVTVELVEQENPDAVIVATGSVYVCPPIQGIEKENVLAVRKADAHPEQTGERVVVCGGGITGLECALALAMEGKKVTVVDQIPRESFVMEMPIFNKADLLGRLEDHHVELIGSETIQAFTDEGLQTKDSEGKMHLYPAETYVNALGVKPDQQLGLALLSRFGTDVHMVGDCVSRGRNYYIANHEGYDAAMRI